MGNSPFRYLLIGLMLLLDFYVFGALKVVTQSASPKTRSIIFLAYWILSMLALLVLILLPY